MKKECSKLKDLILDNGISQAELARYVGISTASINIITNYLRWPKKNVDVVKVRFKEFLIKSNVSEADIDEALNEMLDKQERKTLLEMLHSGKASERELDHVYNALVKRHGIKQINALLNEDEQAMLLAKQSLTSQAKKQFGLFDNPFTNEVRSVEELFLNSDINYVRQALYQTAKHGGFIAISGESGSGKSTLRRDLLDRIRREKLPILIIEPYVIATEDNDIKGKTLKSSHIAEAIINTVSAGQEKPRMSAEARFRQVHTILKNSSEAGYSHLLVIEEAHSTPIATLKQLKRFFELEDGYKKLIGIVLIGQPELANKLSERNPAVREVVQRCESVTLEPLTNTTLVEYLQHRVKSVDKKLESIISEDGIQAIVDRLTQINSAGKTTRSLLYPLAIGNLITSSMNLAAEFGEDVITRDIVMGV
ncbi:MAG: AAA family ATPase [Acinetobacter calcoaceticus]